MTIEQKAAAYDRALEVLHKYDGAHIMFTADLKEEMFPELKESEDERIRKSIINLVIKSAQNGGLALHKWESQQMLAWLEKQKSTETHVDWSEEDERKLELLKALIEDAKGDSTSYSTMFREMEELNNWLKSLKDRVQPKQEWSMYDETILKAIIDNFENKKEFNEAEDYDIVKWLKSLRPQNRWKPSNEQMEAMNTLMVNLIRNPLLLDNFTQANLRLLYDDLKKLK